MLKKLYIYGLLVCLMIATQIPMANAQTVIAQDDPIAAALDSLATKKVLEKYYSKPITPKNSKYHFAPDSIPVYDDFAYEARLSKLDVNSPFDLQYNSVVRGYIDLYCKRKREMVSRMLGQSQLYYPMFEEVLDKYNLPLELKHLAVIESALNPLAKSRAGATGLWQFMYPTGKMYGLNVTSYVDERCDPYKETVAAAEYLQFLYKMFGDWQMVLAAYNGGPGTINHAIRRSGGKKTYWEIRPFLPTETQGYVPAFIAANYVMNYHAEHNIYAAIPKKTYFELDTLVMREPITFAQLSSVLDISVEEIQYFNPIYKKNVIPSGGYVLTLPKTKIGQFVTNENEIYAMIHKQEEQSKVAAATDVKDTEIYHTVKKGEKITTIARKYGVTVSQLKTWNYVGKKGLKAGRQLVIHKKEKTTKEAAPDVSSAAPETNLANKKTEATKSVAENKATIKYYKVKKGDTLFKISKQFGVSQEELKQMNKLGKAGKIAIGQKLKVG